MKLVIYFCGTGNPGSDFIESAKIIKQEDNPLHREDVVPIMVRSCDHPEVCNSEVSPDLAAFAKRFVRKAFEKNDGKLAVKGLTELAKSKIGINAEAGKSIGWQEFTESKEITEIILCGYSRGAVTCFNVAKELDKFGIPISIIANQPVPGYFHAGPGTNGGRVADCSKLSNLKHVSIILGSYTGKPDKGVPEMDMKPGFKRKLIEKVATKMPGLLRWAHRAFFSQIVPKLPQRAALQRKIIFVPRESHHYREQGDIYIQAELYRLLNPGKKLPDKFEKALNNEYPYDFPEPNKLQRIFGKKYVRHELIFGKSFEPFDLKAWQHASKQASLYKSKETKTLDKAYREFDANTKPQKEDYAKLASAHDAWLAAKEGSKSERYELVRTERDLLSRKIGMLFPPKIVETEAKGGAKKAKRHHKSGHKSRRK